MRSVLALAVAAVTLHLVSPIAASATEDWYEDDSDLGSDGEASVVIGGQEISVSDIETAVSEASAIRWIATPNGGFFETEDNGNHGWCVQTRWSVLGDRDEAQVRADAREIFEMLAYQDIGWANIPYADVDFDQPCDVDPVDALPQELIEQAIREVALTQVPRPTPEIPPGFGLPGLRMYLVTGHELTYGPVEVDLDVVGFSLPVTFTAAGTSEVDWGDGTVTTHDVAGLPYPNGQINHVWTDAGPYDITVTDRWTVDYDVAGMLSGTIEGTLDGVTVADFEVRERRAVRTR
jgi:hypothetical protein